MTHGYAMDQFTTEYVQTLFCTITIYLYEMKYIYNTKPNIIYNACALLHYHDYGAFI